MQNKTAVGVIVASLCTAGCLQMSMASGTLGRSFAPWEFDTQFAFWDSHDYEVDGGKLVLKERPIERDGHFLNIRLYGFAFNAGEDRRLWSAQEWRTWRTGNATEPLLLISVRQADQLKDGDEIKFDSNDVLNTNTREPHMTLTYSPGEPPLNSGSEYPDEVKPLGSRVIAKLTVTKLEEQAGFGRTLGGTIEYERDKAATDPDDVVTGKFEVNFSAYLIGERMAECNDQTTEFGSFGGGTADPCSTLSAEP